MNYRALSHQDTFPESGSYSLKKIPFSDIPLEAGEGFEGYSRSCTDPNDYKAGNFYGIWTVKTHLGDCFIAGQRKPQNKDEHSLYIYQYDHCDKPLGYAHIGDYRFKNNQRPEHTWLYFIRNLQVGERSFAKEIMPFLSILSQTFFDKPLNSTRTWCTQENQRPGEKHPLIKIFERLEKEGTVKRERNGSFTFVKEKTRDLLQIQ